MAKAATLLLFVMLSVLKGYGYNTYVIIDEGSLSMIQQSAFNYSKQGNYVEAIRIEELLVNYYSEKPLCQDYIFCLNNLAAFYSDSGQFEKALEIGSKVVELMNDSLKIDLAGKYEIYQHQAIYYENIGNHEESQKYGHTALDIAKQMPLDTWAYPRSLVFLGYSYSELGDYDTAIKLCLEAKSIYDTLDKKPDDYGYVFNDLGAYYCEKGDINKALDYGWTYIDFLKERAAFDKQKYVVALNNLARYYAIIKNSKKAIELSLKALSVIETNHLPNTYLKGRTMEHLATFYANMDNFELARKYCEKAISFFKYIWAPDRPGMINEYRRYLCYAHKSLNLYDKEQKILEVGNNITKLVLSAFSFLPNSGRHLYWEKYSSWYMDELPSYLDSLRTDALIEEGYNSVLFSKGILLNTEVGVKQLIESTNDTTLLMKFYKLQQYKSTILSDNYKSSFDPISFDADKEERDLISLCKRYGDYTKRLRINWKDVEDALSDSDIAIEFSNYTLPDGNKRYFAYALRKNYSCPHFFVLFNEEVLQNENDSVSINKLVWEKFADELIGVKNIYFSPSGMLNQISIEYYIKNKEKYDIYRLSSTRELVYKKQGDFKKAVLYGGLLFDIQNDSVTVRDDLKEEHKFISYRFNPRFGFEPLYETITEVQTIKNVLLEKGVSVQLFMGYNGTEASFKSLSNKEINIIHMSTHGMYLGFKEREKYKSDNNFQFIRYDETGGSLLWEDIALTRSFLVMSGGNMLPKRQVVQNVVDDGILTAQEISLLEFSNLDVVSLSACQTALGDIENEGVYGLQRGFKKAGANTILMSIDKVDDEATKILMVEFYKNLMNGKSKHQSLKDAQKYLRQVENGKFDKPEYWASFIMLDGLN